jgi:glyoxylase-like metal-dependent hydrolase (beta-lactamase superfamily II)
MQEITIHPLLVGTWDSDQSKHTFGFGQGVKTKSFCYIWFIAGAKQKILVDTGCGDPEWAAKYHHPMDTENYRNPIDALAGIGVGPDEIDVIIMTHLHWDHCHNTDMFPKVPILVQKRELQYAIAPLPSHGLTYESQIINMRPPWVKSIEQIEIVEGDAEICPGVSVVTLPGHSKGIQGVLVQTTKGRHLIAGDCCPKKENWLGLQQMKHIPSGIHVDLEEYFETFKKMERIADVVIPGHDPCVQEKSIYPS